MRALNFEAEFAQLGSLRFTALAKVCEIHVTTYELLRISNAPTKYLRRKILICPMFIRNVVSNAWLLFLSTPVLFLLTISGKYVEFLREIDFIRISSLGGRTVSTSKAWPLSRRPSIAQGRQQKCPRPASNRLNVTAGCFAAITRRFDRERVSSTRFTAEITRSEVALCEQQRG